MRAPRLRKAEERDAGSFQTDEPGQADYLFLRNLEGPNPGTALALWVEFKAPGGRLHKGQAVARAGTILRRDGLGGGFVAAVPVAPCRRCGKVMVSR